jgi:hypothetical protein
MNEIQHRDLAAGRWWQLTLAEQLGNIGSEVSRATMDGPPARLAAAARARSACRPDARRSTPPAIALALRARVREVVVDFRRPQRVGQR